MNILYYSVHAILEDDEIRLLQGLGHNVCCLGVNGKDGVIQGYRSSLSWNQTEKSLYDKLYELGGSSYLYNVHIPKSFFKNFDVCIVMHDINFIARYWEDMKGIPVIWRTIGQNITGCEDFLRAYREGGLYIVRYSSMETYIVNGLRQDKFIRFAKDSEIHSGWNGDKPGVLTFVNGFEMRYPAEYSDYQSVTHGFDAFLGGANPGVGFVTFEEQQRLYCEYRAYFHAANLDSPYTLNFIEAWMTGIPIVLYAPFEKIGRFFEMDKLIIDGINGFICRDIATARARLRLLLEDYGLAKQIGEAGRSAAKFYFDTSQLRLEWEGILSAAVKSDAHSASAKNAEKPSYKPALRLRQADLILTKPSQKRLVSINETEAEYLAMSYITPNLVAFERKESSQFSEDGVLEKIAQDLGIENGSFFEFGIGPADGVSFHKGLEGNFVALEKRGWRGVFLDGQTYPPEVGVRQAFVTALNINLLYKSHNVPRDLDFMSIDVDGQDFWIWMALEARPKLMVVEYNAGLGGVDCLTVPFDVNFRWDGTMYQGASLPAFQKLAKSKGYTQVYSNGVNAIFLRNDMVSNKDDFDQDNMFKPYPFPALPADPQGRMWVTV